MATNNLDAVRHLLDDTAVVFGEFDAAILGTSRGLLVYDEDKIIRMLMRMNSWDRTTAVEWFDFNMSAVGEGTPIFVTRP